MRPAGGRSAGSKAVLRDQPSINAFVRKPRYPLAITVGHQVVPDGAGQSLRSDGMGGVASVIADEVSVIVRYLPVRIGEVEVIVRVTIAKARMHPSKGVSEFVTGVPVRV